ncbi:MAG: D-alanyl-lipoteichoic acid biosynthesis protein DltD [Chloroflexi bacterium]|nr:D-alanyl-lipoteichoic acid biosynthesis protein DltD [Chloroflexota bacterium]
MIDSDPMEQEAREVTRFPAGIVAALLALAITVAVCLGAEHVAVQKAEAFLPALTLQPLPIKWESLTFQRAALAKGDWLPIYGSSELYCCGDPYRGTQLFRGMPTGFDMFAVGRAGTGDLFFLESFGALGGELTGKKLIISDSPPWFFSPQGINPQAYAGNFSPEIAEMFIFDAPVSLPLLEGGAHQMLQHTQTVYDRPLLFSALQQLVAGTPVHIAAYWLLKPVGQLDAFVKQMQDVYAALRFMQLHPQLRSTQAYAGPHHLNWNVLVQNGTRIAVMRSSGNPFGFPTTIVRNLERSKEYRQALRLYCAGKTNRENQVYPYPQHWVETMLHSAEWQDLRLELNVLSELHADPLVWSIPMPGLYDDETALSLPAREQYYQQFERITASAHVFALAFRKHDEDRYFLNDTGAHFTPRGWIFAARAADLFWHGASAGSIHQAERDLATVSPAEGLPVHPKQHEYCRGLS